MRGILTAILLCGGGVVAAVAQDCLRGWTAMGPEIIGDVDSVVIFDDGTGPALYASGTIVTASGDASVARWDGSDWVAFGPTFGPAYQRLWVLDLEDGAAPGLYLTRSIDVLKWNGASWVDILPFSVSLPLASLAAIDLDGALPKELVVASPSKTGYLSGSVWTQVATHSGASCGPNGLASYPSGGSPALHVGGSFNSINGVTASGLAAWDAESATWSEVGGGVNGNAFACAKGVAALLVSPAWDGARLWVGGWFTSAGGEQFTNLAAWDGSAWSSVAAGGANGEVRSVRVLDDEAIYVCGAFNMLDSKSSGGLARLTAAGWQALGSFDVIPGGNRLVSDVARLGDDLIAAGTFTTVNGGLTKAVGFARFGCICADVTGDGDVDAADLNAVLAGFGQASPLGDIDRDGDTDQADLNYLLATFGTRCP